MKTGIYVINANYQQYLPWSLRSIEKLSEKPDVLIFIDDCSTDNSITLIKKHFSHIKFDKTIINQENKGAVWTMNHAVETLGEEFGCDAICGLSADDLFHPDYLKETTKILKESDPTVGWIYTHVRRIGDENSIDIHPEWNLELHTQRPFCHGSSLVRYEAWRSVNGLPDVEREEDWEMWKNMTKLGWKGKLCPQILLYWRKHRDFSRTFYKNDSMKLRGKK